MEGALPSFVQLCLRKGAGQSACCAYSGCRDAAAVVGTSTRAVAAMGSPAATSLELAENQEQQRVAGCRLHMLPHLQQCFWDSCNHWLLRHSSHIHMQRRHCQWRNCSWVSIAAATCTASRSRPLQPAGRHHVTSAVPSLAGSVTSVAAMCAGWMRGRRNLMLASKSEPLLLLPLQHACAYTTCMDGAS
jgi:hypothetical protein